MGAISELLQKGGGEAALQTLVDTVRGAEWRAGSIEVLIERAQGSPSFDIELENVLRAALSLVDLIPRPEEAAQEDKPNGVTRKLQAAWDIGDSATVGVLASFRTIQLDWLDGDCLAAVIRIRQGIEATGRSG